MKNLSVKRFCLIFKFLCVPFLIKAQGNVFSYGDSIYRSSNYSLAAVEYERVIFEYQSPSIQAEAAIKRANCLKMLRRYEAAASTLDAINIANLSDSIRYEILFQSILDSYLAHEPNNSYSKLESLCHFYPISAQKPDILLMKILSLNELQRWNEADTVYKKLKSIYNVSNSSFSNPYLRIPKLKDPEIAEKLSAFLPFTGAGFFYAGDIKEGILNVALQIGLISFGGYSILMKRYITCIFIGIGGYAAFYKGGVRRVKRLVVKYNEKKTIAFNTAVRDQLLQIIK
ncbi:MAG TPA: hypothetical protein VFX43_14240 [Chitinophagaceae bacterium]|nr:hypothetical protein [Chitinophagaceae bacterium]